MKNECTVLQYLKKKRKSIECIYFKFTSENYFMINNLNYKYEKKNPYRIESYSFFKLVIST